MVYINECFFRCGCSTIGT
uniref:Uncharacterized protein n=1 Tax=Arundo donax TaxID=35708 RepID=A0A0A9BXG5_ARUDO